MKTDNMNKWYYFSITCFFVCMRFQSYDLVLGCVTDQWQRGVFKAGQVLQRDPRSLLHA